MPYNPHNHSAKPHSRLIQWPVVLVILYSTLALIIDHYHQLFDLNACDSLLLYLVIPLLLVLLIFRQPLSRYGFQLGDWKAGLLLTLAACLGLTLVMAFVARTPAFQNYYQSWGDPALPLPLLIAIKLIGWEFFFRGFILFGLEPVAGPYSILLQAVPFTLAHFGKPEAETISCIFGGAAYGWIAWRTRSFLYPFLVHWYLMFITVLIARGDLF